MAAAVVERKGPAEVSVSGDLIFRTVLHVRERLEAELAGASATQTIDLAGIGHTDSSALSLWLCLRRLARDNGIELNFVNIPDDIRALGKLVGLNDQWVDVAHCLQS